MENAVQRWTARLKVELVLELIKGEKKLVDVSREHDLNQSEVDSWMTTFMQSGEHGLKCNSKEQLDSKAREIKDLRAKVGELVLELDARKSWKPSCNQTRRPFNAEG
jgi:transposase-like protein